MYTRNLGEQCVHNISLVHAVVALGRDLGDSM